MVLSSLNSLLGALASTLRACSVLLLLSIAIESFFSATKGCDAPWWFDLEHEETVGEYVQPVLAPRALGLSVVG